MKGKRFIRRGKEQLRAVPLRVRHRLGLDTPKIFVVGRNKTGTTSLKEALQQLGYRLGNQLRAERLIEDWGRRDFRSLIAYCHTATAFQDVPFSLDYTFEAMDQAFPGSKFILTVRDDPEQWFGSVMRFRQKRHERAGRTGMPTQQDMRDDPYVYPGWIWRIEELMHGADQAPYVSFDKQKLMAHYQDHNARVQDYFRHRPDDLLVLNASHPDAMQRLSAFLGQPYNGQSMPRLNTTQRPDPKAIGE